MILSNTQNTSVSIQQTKTEKDNIFHSISLNAKQYANITVFLVRALHVSLHNTHEHCYKEILSMTTFLPTIHRGANCNL